MKKYRVTAKCIVEVVTIIEANSEEEAISLAKQRDVEICIHGSEFENNKPDENNFCLTDGTYDKLNQFDAYEYD